MKPSIAFFLALSTASVLASLQPHGHSDLVARHNRMVKKAVAVPSKRATQRRCKKRKSQLDNASSPKSAAKASEGSSKPPAKEAKHTPSLSDANVLKVESNKCGPIGATKKTTAVSGPNGNIDWLNCGLESGGWNPQYVRIEDIVTVPLDDALKSPSSPFKACKDFVPIFDKYGAQFGIPPIMLASFAMQESSCNPNTIGGGGEQGLMQITQEKCGGAPGGDCRNPDFNIRTGAKFFADTLNRNNGDLLRSLGSYNGWFVKMTANDARAAAKTSCCRCQNNMDYLHQFLNGWLQNINAYDSGLRLGKFFNLDVCK
ncbi:hypothetical protein HGRIS_002523 [Hohenbuehelia grisea]|uniref:Transglycosylase SLT domain-containing protein n=1 Tax=Hohenbuehelia grisea TaxID=104357 RepID=A0ABR3JKQ5_9AGAR